MPQAPNIDGVLITWGDRLFYPGNRVVKVKPQPKLMKKDVLGVKAASRLAGKRWLPAPLRRPPG